jgi:hypothetical protein
MVRLVPFAEAMKTVLAGTHGDALVPSSRLRNERSEARRRTKRMPRARYLAVRQWGLRMLKPRTMLRIAVAGLAIDPLIGASTLAPNAPLLPEWPQFVLRPLIFVVRFSSVLRFTSDRGRPKWQELLRGLPPGIIVAFIVCSSSHGWS